MPDTYVMVGYSPDRTINVTAQLQLPPTEWFNANETLDIDTENEPPLLDELEIHPQLILEKVRIMLNPLQQNGEACQKFNIEFDLAGPMMFPLWLGCCLFVMGKHVTFQHVYMLCMMAVLFMYQLMRSMEFSKHDVISVKFVASILGYGLVHTMWLAAFAFFVRLNNVAGLGLAAFSVYCSALGTSRIFAATEKQPNKMHLIAVPLALIYCLFALFVVF